MVGAAMVFGGESKDALVAGIVRFVPPLIAFLIVFFFERLKIAVLLVLITWPFLFGSLLWASETGPMDRPWDSGQYAPILMCTLAGSSLAAGVARLVESFEGRRPKRPRR